MSPLEFSVAPHRFLGEEDGLVPCWWLRPSPASQRLGSTISGLGMTPDDDVPTCSKAQERSLYCERCGGSRRVGHGALARSLELRGSRPAWRCCAWVAVTRPIMTGISVTTAATATVMRPASPFGTVLAVRLADPPRPPSTRYQFSTESRTSPFATAAAERRSRRRPMHPRRFMRGC